MSKLFSSQYGRNKSMGHSIIHLIWVNCKTAGKIIIYWPQKLHSALSNHRPGCLLQGTESCFKHYEADFLFWKFIKSMHKWIWELWWRFFLCSLVDPHAFSSKHQLILSSTEYTVLQKMVLRLNCPTIVIIYDEN